MQAAEKLGVSGRDLASIIGVSEAALSLLMQGAGEARLAGKSYELALLFVRLYRSLDAITGEDDAVSRSWMRNRNEALGGVPLERIRTTVGLTHVLGYLDASHPRS